jgi:glycosyltransferase involved in cell wall biosynthesis
MNILFLDQFSKLGGGQRSLLELLPAIPESGWTGRVALPSWDSFADRIRAIGIPVDTIRCGSYPQGHKGLGDSVRFIREMPRLAGGINSLVTKNSIDMLYVNGPRLLPAAALVAGARAIPLVFHSHHRLMQPSAVRLVGRMLRWSGAKVIACCRFAADALRPHLIEGQCTVLYNGVPDLSRTERRFCGSTQIQIGVVGRVEAEKGQMEFVRAAQILAREFPMCRFVVTGAPLFSGSEYLDQVRAASRGISCEFAGWQEDITGTLSGLDLLVVPSTEIDSTPRIILEAFSAGVPVVAFRAGGIPEIVTDGRTGFLAAGATGEALAERIRSVLLMAPDELLDVTRRARQAWSREFTLERFRRGVTGIIAQLFS